MSQIIFTLADTKAVALAALNANFTEVYTTVAGHTTSIASINAALAALGTMAAQNANAIAVTGGTMSGVAITTTAVSAGSSEMVLTASTLSQLVIGRAGHGDLFYNGDITAAGYLLATVGIAIGGDVVMVRAAANVLRQANGTADQTLSIGAASGTGGGVVSIHQIVTPPTPTSEDAQVCFDGVRYIIDKPVDLSAGPPTFPAGSSTVDPTVSPPSIVFQVRVGSVNFAVFGYTLSP